MQEEDFFEQVTDYWESGHCLHELSDNIWLVLCELSADCATVEDSCDYACDKEGVLRQFLSRPAGIPSHDTLNRVFRYLDPCQLEACLTHWGAAIGTQLAGRQLIVDGQQLLAAGAGLGERAGYGYVRSHWGVENYQHWHLAVMWDEDDRRCRHDHAPRNLFTLHKWP